MYAAKLPGDGAHMFDACTALCDAMGDLDVAIDGGKDSLSMAARADGEVVKAPGSVVMSGYVTVPDVTKTITPDLKKSKDGSSILLVEFGSKDGKRRLGGSALAQAYGQMGDVSPDMDDPKYFRKAWEATQALIADRKISAGHDVSDGGFVTAALEMAFPHPTAGMTITLPSSPDADVTAALFAEELAIIIEISSDNLSDVLKTYSDAGVTVTEIGTSTDDGMVIVKVGYEVCLDGAVKDLRDIWEATSFALERMQSSEATVKAEEAGLRDRQAPNWHLTYTPEKPSDAVMNATDKVKVCILREEGSNGDREMSAAIHSAGMEPWDVTMSDLLNGSVDLSDFRGIVFVGGFSYADVLDSAKGWAGSIKFNEELWIQFKQFYDRSDTFSLGVCNGCQLMALLGFVPAENGLESVPDEEQPRFIHNDSGRFESRWVTVGIDSNTPAVMLDGMQGSKLGVWIAHGEGKVKFPDEERLKPVVDSGCAPIRYVDPVRCRWVVLQRRQAPGDDATPGTRVFGVANALVPGRLWFNGGRARTVAQDVPKRQGLGGEERSVIVTDSVTVYLSVIQLILS